MRRIILKSVAIFLAIIMVMFSAPLEEISKIDFVGAFNTIAHAIESTVNPHHNAHLGDINVVEMTINNDKYEGESLFTQNVLLGIGDSETLVVEEVLDENGEPTDDYDIKWTANPENAVELRVREDTRYCDFTILDTTATQVTISAHLWGQTNKTVIDISNNEVRFTSSDYYVIVDSDKLVNSFNSGISANAVWMKDRNENGNQTIQNTDFTFTSSDESILSVDNSKNSHSYGSGYAEGKVPFKLIPSVYGVKEGTVTLTVKTASDATAQCTVTVVALKEYKIEAYSQDLQQSLPDSTISYDYDSGSVSSNSIHSVKTGSDGVATVLIPDARFFDGDISITSPAHEDISFCAKELVFEDINREQMELDFDIKNIAVPQASIDGPVESSDGESKAIFNFDMGMDLGLSNSAETNNVETKTVGDLLKSGKKIKIKIKVPKKTVEILFGIENKYLDTDEKWNECYQDAKSFYEILGKSFYDNSFSGGKNNIGNNTYKRLYDKLNKNRFGFVAEVEGSIFFFAKFSWASGELKPVEGGAVVTASLKFEKQIPWFWAVYVKFKLGGEIEGKISLEYEDQGSFAFNLDITIKFFVSFGVGVGCDVIGIDINAELDLYIKFHLGSKSTSWDDRTEVYLTGRIFVEGHLNAWIIKVKGELVEWKYPNRLYLWPPSKFGQLVPDNVNQDNISYEILDRQYINGEKISTQSLSGNGYISDVYPYAEPQLVKLSDGRIVAVWLMDNGLKSDVNCTTLYYSVLDSGIWTDPAPINEFGSADEAAKIVTDGQKIHLIYQRGKKVFSDDTSVEEYVENTELVYSCFENGEWSTPFTVGTKDSGKYKSLYSISTLNDKTLISWIENSDNNPFLNTGTNTIYKQEIDGTVIGSVETVDVVSKKVYSVCSAFINNNPMVAYSVDMDGEADTFDADVFVEGTNITNDSLNDVAITYQNGIMYWQKDGYLYSYNGVIEPIGLYLNENKYNVLNDSGKSAVVYNSKNGFKSELVIRYLINGEFTNPVNLTNYGERIGDYDVVFDQNGNPIVSTTIRHIDSSQENGVYSSTDFCIEKISPEVVLSLKDVWYDMDKVVPGEDLTINVTVCNEGTTSVNNYSLNVLDGISNNSSRKTINTNLLPGESDVVELTFKVPDSLSRRNINVSLIADSNISEEVACDVAIGFADVSLNNCQITPNGIITGDVNNGGYDTADDVTVNIYHLDDEKVLLKSIVLEDINALALKSFSYSVSQELLAFDSYLNSPTFFIEVLSGNEDYDYSNNTEIVSVQPVRVSSIELSKHTIVLAPNDTIQLTTTVLPSNATDKRVYWFTDDDDVATVDEDGKVIGVGLGTTNIKAISTDGRFEDVCTVTVSETVPVTGIQMQYSTATVLEGQTRQLIATVLPENATNKSVVWSSDSTTIASVDSNGVVTAKKSGTAKITVKTVDGNYKAVCNLTVTKSTVAVTGVSISDSNISMEIGRTKQLSAIIAPQNATNYNVSWTSNNSTVVSVNSSGLLTAKKAGKATITVTTADGGFTATCQVTVTAPVVSVTGIELLPSRLEMKVGDKAVLNAEVLPSNATNKFIVWKSEDTDVATVSSTGEVTALSEGTTFITATTKDGNYFARSEIVVGDKTMPPNPASVKIKNYVATKDVAYKTTVIFTAVTDNLPSGAIIQWYKDDVLVGTGEKCTIKQATSTYNIQAKIVQSGRVIAESEKEIVKVNTGFFAKVIAFIRGLFGRLPVIEQ